MASMKKDLDPKFALGLAQKFLHETRDLYARAAIAGSLRRKAPVIHDIDFAVIPRGRDFAVWKDQVSKRVQNIGGAVMSFGEVISDFLYEGVQVNLFICPGRDSWGVTYMWATGPRGHTIGMNVKARNLGLLVNSQGIWTREEPPRPIPARTEREVGRILGWKYKPPEERGKGGNKKEPRFYC